MASVGGDDKTLPMKTLKITLVSFLFPILAQAETMSCTITESISGDVKSKTIVAYDNAGATHHGILPYDVEYATGFLAISGGYVVVQIQTKADKRAFSFRAKKIADNYVSGMTCLSDASTCISVDCL